MNMLLPAGAVLLCVFLMKDEGEGSRSNIQMNQYQELYEAHLLGPSCYHKTKEILCQKVNYASYSTLSTWHFREDA